MFFFLISLRYSGVNPKKEASKYCGMRRINSGYDLLNIL